MLVAHIPDEPNCLIFVFKCAVMGGFCAKMCVKVLNYRLGSDVF